MVKRVLIAVVLSLIVIAGIGFGAVFFFSSQYSLLLQEKTEAAARNSGTETATEDDIDDLTAQAEQALRDNETNETDAASSFENTAFDSTAWGEAAGNYAIAAADSTNSNIPDEAALRAAQIVEGMTLTEKICQMMIVKPETLTGYSQVYRTGTVTKNAYDKYPVGGIMYYSQNLQSMDQTRTMISDLQAYVDETTGYGLFTCINEEGGNDAVACYNLGTTAFSCMREIGETGDISQAEEVGKIQSAELTDLGLNVNFAPDADVLSNVDNTTVQDRSFGSDASLVSDMVSSVISGFKEGNMLCSAKYFPGYGSIGYDTTNGFPSTDISYEELQNRDLLPFEAAIDAGVPMITVANAIYTQLDDELPASLSPTIVTGILRDELGFNGIIITDALNTGSMSVMYTQANAAVAAIQAGCDMLMCPSNISSVLNAVTNAVNNGTIEESRIDESCVRILAAKLRYGIMGG